MNSEVLFCESAPIAFAAEVIGDKWVFRGSSEVYAWDPRWPDLLSWEYLLPDDRHFGHKWLLTAAGLAISFADLGQEGARLVALDPADGRVVWQRFLDIRPDCFAVAENGLHLRGGRDRYAHAVIDPRTGDVSRRVSSTAGDGLVVLGGLMLLASGDGLFMAPIDAPDRFAPVSPYSGAVTSMTAAGDLAWFLFEDPAADLEYRVARFNPITGDRRQGTPEVSRAAVELTPMNSDQVVLLPGEEAGVERYDLSADVRVWRVGIEERMTGHRIVSTPCGLFALVEPPEGRATIWRLDRETGQRLDFPDFTGTRSLHRLDDTLVTTGLDGLFAVRGWD